jgi:tRNA-splicing ligase RtcB
MSLIQLDLPVDAVADKTIRRALINAIVERTPTGAGKGQRNVKNGRNVNAELGCRVAIKGASEGACRDLGIPPERAARCEDTYHFGHNNQRDDLAARLDFLISPT